MIRGILSTIVIYGLSSLAFADVASSVEGDTLYAVRNTGFNVDEDTGQRIGLANKDYIFLHILGDSEPYLVGLSIKEFKPKAPADLLIKKSQFLAFRIGKRLDHQRAEILAYGKDFRVGTVKYGYDVAWNSPYEVSELCSGTYEAVCTLGFDSDAKKFTVKLHEELQVPDETSVCK